MTDLRFNLKRAVKSGRWIATRLLAHPVVMSGLLVTGLVLGVREVAGLQPLELLAFDQMVRLRPDAGPDPRMLVVAITEDDIRAQNRWPLSDEVVAELLAKLQQQRPRVIGLDIYRDVPHAPGHAALTQQLRAPNVMAIRMLGSEEDSGVAAPPGIPDAQVGFSDFLVDPDTIVRRNLLFAKTKTDRFYSFSLRTSLAYLAKEQRSLTIEPEALQIGDTEFQPLHQDSGGYRTLDDLGYQVLLHYRSANNVARQVTLTQVLNGNVDPKWITDKLVLIGTTAPSAKDLFLTPYNLSAAKSPTMPGVFVHAQMTSQILSAVLDRQPLLWYWSEPEELLWIGLWSFVGATIAWRFRHPLGLGSVMATATLSLFGICLGVFTQAGWIPLVPAAIGLVGAGIGVVVYRLLHDAFHDALTGLPNRALFTKHLQWATAHRAGFKSGHLSTWTMAHGSEMLMDLNSSDAGAVAVLFLGLDSFKAINDSFGHRLGDQLLVAMTQRLKNCLHRTDQLARVGGDEFVILRRDVKDTEEVTHLADLLKRQVTLPFKLNGQEVFTTASVGIVLDRVGSDCEPEDILRDAHTAMHRAKASGKARHQVFVTGMRTQVVTRLQLEADLRRAIERQEFQLHYQPLIALATGKIAGFEALVRWQHPTRGFVSPVEFIPVAEEIDLIIPLGQWILQEACQQLKVWQTAFPKNPPLLVSVNLSAKQFSQPDLVEQIQHSLQKTGVEGRNLKLEITESMAMTDVEATIALLVRLKALDLKLSIDDFGTGYSSLSYLHRFPTSTIKVDRSFVSRMGYEREDAHIVQTIIMLGHNLGMEIVAEGVETAEQLNSLRSLKCEYGQGYFFSRPLAAEVAGELLSRDPKW